MSDQSDLSDRCNDPRARNLVVAIEEFVTAFRERTERHSADVMIKPGSRLDGRKIKQRPERFIEKELIDPIADALDYEIRYQPKGFAGLEARIPDFEVLNLDTENFGEIKNPGGIGKARQESVEYLDMAEKHPLLGIATDGFTWVLYRSFEDEPEYINHERVYSILDKVRMEQSHDRATRRRRPELREKAFEFVEEFHIDALRSKV